MNGFKSPLVFLILSLLTALVCLVSISKRVEIEKANDKVMIAVESDALESLAVAGKMSLEVAIEKLKKQGLSGLVVSEQTIGELVSDRMIELPGAEEKSLRQRSSIATKTPTNYLICDSDLTTSRVQKGLKIRFGFVAGLTGNGLGLPTMDVSAVRSTTIGLNPKITTLARNSNLSIIARANNQLGADTQYINQTIAWFKESGASVFLALGEQVLGRRDALPATQEALLKTKMRYASPEFAKLGGDEEMLNANPENVIRLHAAQSAELDKLSIDGAVERYRKAARERNMRILLVRNASLGGDNPVDSLGEFIGQIKSKLESERLTIGTPVPYTDPAIPKSIRLAIGLLGGISALWVATRLFGDKRGLVVGVIGALGILAGCATNGKGLQISALLLSLVFPIGAYLWLMATKPRFAIAMFATPILGMIGGFCVAALLNGIAYYVRADTFPGVKVSVFLPIVIIGIAAFADLNELKSAMKEPITWGAAALGIVILGVLGFMLVRTGNESPSAVSGGELAFRGWLEQLMPVRPRSKEFIIGFPALFVGIAMLSVAGFDRTKLGKTSGWVALLIMLGSVGLTDVVNTLCHLHTPFLISLIRNIEGIVIGCLIGAALWFATRKTITRWMAL